MVSNAGVPQGSELSPTLFVLHINDQLEIPNFHCFADDSTVDARYTGPANTRALVEQNKDYIVTEVEKSLNCSSDWGKRNLVQFNPSKTQLCVFSAKKSPFVVTPKFQGTPLYISKNIGVLGVTISSDVQFRNHLESKAKMAAKKLGILNRSKQYFTPKQRLVLYKAQVRPHMEYCSHLWAGSPAYQLDTFDSIQRRAIRIVDDPMLTCGLEPLSLRREIGSLCVFYRVYNGECSEELFDLVPSSSFLGRTLRGWISVHPHTLKPHQLAKTVRFSRTFLPRTLKLWNGLPSAVFPLNYDMGVFKKGVKNVLLGRQRNNDASCVAVVHGRH